MTSICLLSSEIQTHLLVASQTQQSAMLQDHAGAMAALMTEACAAPNRRKPAVAVVGATLDSSLATQGVQMVTLRNIRAGRNMQAVVGVCQSWKEAKQFLLLLFQCSPEKMEQLTS